MPSLAYPPELPITGRREEIIAALLAQQVLIVAGDTGSGKTTQLPKMCLEAGLGRDKMIACTQPRRIAATSVAARVTAELGEEGPALVGYRIRFADRTRSTTRIKFLTDGMLLAEAAGDPTLSRYDAIIIDEAHERSVNIDFLLGILKRLCPRRPELRLVISSATLDTEKFSRHFEPAPVITIPGRVFPVEVRYLPAPEAEEEASLVERAAAAVRLIVRQRLPGDILVFMATERDIVEVVEVLRAGPDGGEIEALPLFGRLSSREQARIFSPCPRRKVVVATNVAETSLTVPGIRYVVDSGVARISSYSPRARTTKLPVRPISKASADQRRGRCGRLGPGICLRLYSEEDYQRREAFTPPEIVRTNLAEVILRMLDLRLGLPGQFPFLDPPSPKSIKDGLALLRELAAVEDAEGEAGPKLTKLGRTMARLPLDPCVSRMILEARERGVLEPVTVIAAALSIPDPRLRPLGQEQEADLAHRRFVAPSSDFVTYLNIWRQYQQVASQVGRARLVKFCRQNFLAHQRMREWGDIHQQIHAALGRDAGVATEQELAPGDWDAVHQAILCGLLRNIAVKKDKNLYTAALGREVMVFPGSGQFNKAGQWLMAAEMVETTRLYARTVATINPDWLEAIAGPLCRASYSDPHWEKRRGQVVAFQKVTLFGLTIVSGRRVNYGPVNPAESRAIFIQAALVEGEISREFDFLSHNRQLIERAREIEERTRRRQLVDDFVIKSFYDRCLPDKVWDLAGLVRALPRLGTSLFLREDDLLAPDDRVRQDFPSELAAGPFRLALSYKFSPGDGEDGVSAHIPQAALAHLDPAIFAWLVPGLLAEKVILLLRALPKDIRRRLMPLAETANRLLDGLAPRAGESLLPALTRRLKQGFAVDIAPDEWREDKLPDHLRMRLCLVDEEGKTLVASRDFAALFSASAPDAAAPGRSLRELKRRWERDGVTGLHPDLPQSISILGPDGALAGYAFPALVETGGRGLGIRLFASEEEAKGQGREGLKRLYALRLEPQMRRLAKDLALAPAEWPLFQWLGGVKEVNAQICDFLLDAILLLPHGLPSGEEFERRVAALADGGLYRRAGDLFHQVRLVLLERGDTSQTLKKFQGLAPSSPFTGQRFAGYAEALADILPPDFLATFDLESLELAPRYLKALRLRVERAHPDPSRDQDKGRLVADYLRQARELKQDWFRLAIPARREAAWPKVQGFCRLVDEFGVSIFAPELKPLLPVSPKRLALAYQEARKLLS